MEIEQLTMPKKKAEEEFQALKQAFKQNTKLRREQIRQDLKKVYGHLRHGKKIIDIYESFKKAGLNKEGDPKLAIVRADSKRVLYVGKIDGSATFYHDNEGKRPINQFWRLYNQKADIKLPEGTFTWLKNEKGFQRLERKIAIVPIIPAKILVKEVKILIKNFHILWEVEQWKPIPPRDPILLRQLTPNLFGVLATWNLTKLERAIIRARITGEA